LTRWPADAGIPVLLVRGFGSQSYADVVHDRVTADPRVAALLGGGDFDCSGEDIEQDWVARTGCWSHTERVLLICEQVRAYELPATGSKRGDPRWPAFARRYGFDPRCPVQWEVEALEPAEPRLLVLAAVDPDVLARQIAREEAQRRAPWSPFWTAGTRRAGERSRSAVRAGALRRMPVPDAAMPAESATPSPPRTAAPSRPRGGRGRPRVDGRRGVERDADGPGPVRTEADLDRLR
jgi:hypothetical protein